MRAPRSNFSTVVASELANERRGQTGCKIYGDAVVCRDSDFA